jgi:hypothetical protein
MCVGSVQGGGSKPLMRAVQGLRDVTQVGVASLWHEVNDTRTFETLQIDSAGERFTSQALARSRHTLAPAAAATPQSASGDTPARASASMDALTSMIAAPLEAVSGLAAAVLPGTPTAAGAAGACGRWSILGEGW